MTMHSDTHRMVVVYRSEALIEAIVRLAKAEPDEGKKLQLLTEADRRRAAAADQADLRSTGDEGEMSDGWGEWVDHDGRSCPEGQYVHFVTNNGLQGECIAGSQCRALGIDPHWHPLSMWAWAYRNPDANANLTNVNNIVRYRIRRSPAADDMIAKFAGKELEDA